MKYTIRKEEGPAYLQLYRRMRDDIVGGVYPYHGRLPSERTLSGEAGVSVITVEHTYALLCDEGYAESRARSGYFVIFRQADGFASGTSGTGVRRDGENGAPGGSVAAGGGAAGASGTPGAVPPAYPAFPASVLRRTMRRVLSDCADAVWEKSPNAGLPVLRDAIRQYLRRNRGIGVAREQIIVGSGAEYLYGLIVQLFGRERVYAVETPSYEIIGKIYRAAGVPCEFLPLSEDGIDPRALAASRADILHTTPYRSFPSGVTASASRRHDYIRWASEGDRYIIESDYGSEFAVSSQPFESLFVLSPRDNVVYLNTFSRTLSPSMRFAYMVLPARLVAPFTEKLGFYSCTVPTFEQYVLAALLDGGDFERHINRVRRYLRRAEGPTQ